MVETTLAVASLLTYVVAVTYGYVGLRLLRHADAARSTRRPMVAFALWWLLTSANQFLGSTLYLAAALGFRDLPLQLAYALLQRLLLALSLVGLMHYLLFLHTGRSALVPLVVLYGAYWASQVYLVLARNPVGVAVFAWRTDLLYAHPELPGQRLLNLAIVLPPIAGALGLLRLYGRVEGRTRRLRIATLAGGFTLWWVVAVAAGHPATFEVGWLQAANRALGVLIALCILLAYQPTPWMQRRYHLEAPARRPG